MEIPVYESILWLQKYTLSLKFGTSKTKSIIQMQSQSLFVGYTLVYIFRPLNHQNEIIETSSVNITWLGTKVSN